MYFCLVAQDPEFYFAFKTTCTEDQISELMENDTEFRALVNHIETTYGVLDIDGEGNRIGYTSYEIETKDYRTIRNMFMSFFRHRFGKDSVGIVINSNEDIV